MIAEKDYWYYIFDKKIEKKIEFHVTMNSNIKVAV